MHIVSLPLAALLLTACSADNTDLPPADAQEMEQLQSWARDLKASDPDTARALIRECGLSGAFGSAADRLATARCMKAKYDEGVRA